MMRVGSSVWVAIGLLSIPAAWAQFGSPGGGGPGVATPGGGSPGTTLAQFQPGLNPLRGDLDLAPGRPVRVAMYCADLFAATPTDRVRFTAPGSEASVVLASGLELSLGEALESGLLQARGRGPGDPPRRGGHWFDLYLTNRADQPAQVSLPAGTLLVPAGQPVPDVRPSVRRLFAAAGSKGLLGSEALASAVWATRGFTREDVEHTTLTPLSDAEAVQVQALLVAADLGYDFARGRGEYAKLFEQRRVAMSNPAPVSGSALLPHGKSVRAEVVASAGGEALISLQPAKGGGPLYAAGRVVARRADRLEVELRHLKTGRPLEMARAPIRVKLAAQVARR
jgi:hypothetical protein